MYITVLSNYLVKVVLFLNHNHKDWLALMLIWLENNDLILYVSFTNLTLYLLQVRM